MVSDLYILVLSLLLALLFYKRLVLSFIDIYGSRFKLTRVSAILLILGAEVAYKEVLLESSIGN